MHSDDRLPTSLWVDAHLRRLSAQGVACYVINKGAWAAGTVLLKINATDGRILLLQQQRDIDGVMGWMDVFQGKPVEESKVDDYIRRSVDRDPDLWAIEIEDRDLLNPFEGVVLSL